MLRIDLMSIFNFYLLGCILNFFMMIIIVFIVRKSLRLDKRFFVKFLLSTLGSWVSVIYFIDELISLFEKTIKVKYPKLCAIIMLLHQFKLPTKKKIITYYYDIKYLYRVKATEKKVKRYFKTSFLGLNDEYNYRVYVRDRFIEMYGK